MIRSRGRPVSKARPMFAKKSWTERTEILMPGVQTRKENIVMKTRHLFSHILAVLLAFPLLGTSARAATIEVLQTFDYPGTGNQTRPQKINDRGVIVGIFLDSSGASRGFTRSRDGVFSAPIIEPNDTG